MSFLKGRCPASGVQRKGHLRVLDASSAIEYGNRMLDCARGLVRRKKKLELPGEWFSYLDGSR
jgi:hypothetical protein